MKVTPKNLLAEQSTNYVFISKQTVESDPNAQAEYIFTIDNETLSQRVVIATSILDNDIDIKNDTLTENVCAYTSKSQWHLENIPLMI